MTTSELIQYFSTFTLRDIAQILIWFPPAINFVGMCFQVQKNSQLRSAVGMSNVFMMLRYLTACAQILYLYFLDLPFAYRVMILPQWVLLAVLVWQQIYYAETHHEGHWLTGTTISLTVVWIYCMYLGVAGYGTVVGEWSGWLMVFLGAIVQLPQIYRNYRRKSTHGYSLGYVCFSLVAYSFDWTLAAIIGVPIQTHVAYTRAMSYRLFELGQFYMYKKK